MTNDVLQPIHDGNRDEIFIVEFDGFIKNQTEGIVRAMLRDLEDWEESYPSIKDFEGLTSEELYDQTMLFNAEEFLTLMCDGKIPIEEIVMDVETITKSVIITEQQNTMFEFALYRLLQENFVKKCYIIKSTPWTENEKDYIRNVYDESIDKIEAGEGDILSLMDEVKDATTIFLSDFEDLSVRILDHFGLEGLDGKMFILRNCLNNIIFSDIEDDVIELAYNDEIEVINEMKYFGISRMFVSQVDEEEMLSKNGTLESFEESNEDDDTMDEDL